MSHELATVRMYPGDQAPMYAMANGRGYQAARGMPVHVHPDDVADLERLGWGRSDRPEPSPEELARMPKTPPSYPILAPGQKVFRMLPPQGRGVAFIEYEGRTYDGTPGLPLDVPESDARVLKANGWLPLMEVGSKRPFNPARGERFLDAEAGIEMVFDGFRWLDARTGEVA